jgi:hypothetical protein
VRVTVECDQAARGERLRRERGVHVLALD